MRRLFPLLMLFALAALLTGCEEKKKYRICVSQCSQDDWRMKMNDEINREILLHDDATVEICSADDSSEKQIADIRRFMQEPCDILIVSPNEAAALTPVIKEVYERGTPVIVFDRNINGDTYTARIGVDDVGLGRAAARYAQHLIGTRGKVIEIYGLPGSTPAEDRHKGFAAQLQAQGGTILASAAADWKKEEAVRAADSLLNLYPDAQLVYAHNDRMAIGASEAARAKGRRDIRIIGIDAAPNIGIRAVADSVIDATFLYPTEGHRLVQTALAILKGEPYERETILPVSSAVDLSNADILLLQNETLDAETRKIKLLKGEIDDYWAQHNVQTTLFYACVAIIVLLFGVGFLLLRAYWQHSRHQKELMLKNSQLEQERDKQARLNEQLEQATQSKLMFFTNVSHDLRTPLTLIAEPVAQLAAAPNLTPRQLTLAKLAHKNLKIISRLINQILDFRKYENGQMALNLAETASSKPTGRTPTDRASAFRSPRPSWSSTAAPSAWKAPSARALRSPSPSPYATPATRRKPSTAEALSRTPAPPHRPPAFRRRRWQKRLTAWTAPPTPSTRISPSSSSSTTTATCRPSWAKRSATTTTSSPQPTERRAAKWPPATCPTSSSATS